MDILSIEYKVLGSIDINEFITDIYQNRFQDTCNHVLNICKNEDYIISFNKEQETQCLNNKTKKLKDTDTRYKANNNS